MRVLVTGATGFIGQALVSKLLSMKLNVVVAVRKYQLELPQGVQQFFIGNLSEDNDWQQALQGVDVVIHAAARAHVFNDQAGDSLEVFRLVNVKGTINLASQALEAEVKRFIFISSIGANGNQNCAPFTELDAPSPVEAYAVSKLEAELGLKRMLDGKNIDLVIIRPPLVYGPKPPGNFETLIHWALKDMPLPFGAIYNKRSFVALDNLANFITCCVEHPKAANEVFLISDGEDVSTTELLRKVGKAFGKKVLLLPVPVGIMKLAAKFMGKDESADKLFGSLQVDSSKARNLLNWKPVVTMDEQLKKTAEACRNEESI